jgi:hypothetical protein
MRNVGAGPALYIRSALDPQGASPDDVSRRGAVGPGDTVDFDFDMNPGTAMFQLLVDYRSMSGRTYGTAVVLEPLGSGHARAYDVHFSVDDPLTAHGDAVPQVGLKQLPRWP